MPTESGSTPPPLPPLEPRTAPPPLPPAPAPPDQELTARQKFSCPLCGGEARWDPARQTLVCAYCGTESPAKPTDSATAENGAAIEEHDLVVALRSVPDADRGWATATLSVRCQSCQAISVFPGERAGQRCEFCGSSALVPYDALRAPIRPESVLPFRVAESQVRDAARQWYRNRWFAPNALKKAALTDQVHGFYLPYWTFDAQAHCPWTAESGYHYYTTESYTDGKGQSQTRQVRHTRWVPASGAVDHFFDDILVPASRGVPGTLLTGLEPFPTSGESAALVPYDPAFLSGWTVEQYQLDLAGAAQRGEELMHAKLRSLCSSEVPGDTQRNLQIYPQYSERTFKHLLLPVWVMSYRYNGTAYQLLVNGATGTLAGVYPKSWIKITLLVVSILVVVLIILALNQSR